MIELLIWGIVGLLFHFGAKLLRSKNKRGKDFHFINFFTDHIYNILLSLVVVVGIGMYPVASWDLFMDLLAFFQISFIKLDVCLFVALPPSMFVIGYMGDSIMRKVIQGGKSIISLFRKKKK